MEIQYLSVTWDHYHALAQRMAEIILKDPQGPYDEIVAIARGGLTLGHLLSDYLRITISSITIQSYTDIKKQGELNITAGLAKIIKDKHVLLVDDIADTGKTLVRATAYLSEFNPSSIATATMFYKPHCSVKPTYYAEETEKWILLPFEVTEWIYTFTKKMTAEGKSAEEIRTFLQSLGYTQEQITFVQTHHLHG